MFPEYIKACHTYSIDRLYSRLQCDLLYSCIGSTFAKNHGNSLIFAKYLKFYLQDNFCENWNCSSLFASSTKITAFKRQDFNIVSRETRGVAPADCWNGGKWGLNEYNWKGLFLGWFFGLFVLVQEIFVLPWLLLSAHHKIFFPHCTLFQFICPNCPARWPGSRAGSPVS